MEINQKKLFKFIRVNRFKIDSIVEIGARDCGETIKFARQYPKSKIITFECNPQTIGICRNRIKTIKNAKLIEAAVSDKNGFISFYAIDPEKTETTWKDGNPGASSILQASGDYPIEKYVQKKIKVKSIRMDKAMKENSFKNVDLLWMDIQGAELMALKSFGKNLKNIKIIHTEVEFMQIYKEQPLFEDIKSYLEKKGFIFDSFTAEGQYSGDAIFINPQVLSIKEKITYKITKIIYKKKLGNTKIHLKSIIRQKKWYVEQSKRATLKRVLLLPLLIIKKKFGINESYNFKGKSNNSIDIVIPAVDKDSAVLPKTIFYARKYIKHPINNIFIVGGSKSIKVKSVAKKYGCIFINEDSVLPISKGKINYSHNKEDRSGWILQMLIKLNSDKISKEKNILVLDADLVFTRPVIFMKKNRPIFQVSEQYHVPYYDANKSILSLEHKMPFSFISHHMLLDSKVLESLKRDIEKMNGKKWYNSIIENIQRESISGFSEYELYGDYFVGMTDKPYSLSLWETLDTTSKDLKKINTLNKNNKYSAIAFHNYKR